MTNKSPAAIAMLLVANGLVACSNPHAPTAPSAPPGISPPNPAGALVLFRDPLTGLSTSDVRDARGHVVQFTTASELIWIDGTRLSGHQVGGPGIPFQGNVPPEPSCQCWLVVRFGAADGERRAYMTADLGHSNPGTVVDLEITGGGLVVRWTDMFPPGTYTLSGYVTEATATGPIPIENAEVWRIDEERGGWDHTTTDKAGLYQLHGLSDGHRPATFSREGYEKIDLSDVPVHGDTRFDVHLLRR
jgi:Carboxypeptidase regulatory-like domain